MSTVLASPAGADTLEMGYLQRELQRAASSPELGENSLGAMISSSTSSEPAPPVPRKSSRRNMRLTVISETRSHSTAEPSESSSSSPARTSYESSPTTSTSDDALDHVFHRFEGSHLEKLPPHYDEMPMVPHKSPSRRRSRGSSTSSRTYSDYLPEYQSEIPVIEFMGPTNALLLTAQEKQALKETYKDPEADAEVEREDSVYDLPIINEIPEPEPVIPASTGSKTLHILAKGVHPKSFRAPQKETSINITNADETVAYTAFRENRSNSNFTMSTLSSGTILKVSFDGPATLSPVHADSIEGIQEPFTIASKSIKRNQSFHLPGSPDREFEWRYTTILDTSMTRKECLELVEALPQNQPQEQQKKLKSDSSSVISRRSSMLMRRISRLNSSRANVSKAQQQHQPPSAAKMLAQLIRFDKSGMQQSREWRGASRPGNGGELRLEPGCIDAVPEEVVVATALVMLEKEQDRRRGFSLS